MKKFCNIAPVILVLFLTSCSFLSGYKMDIQQGNIISQDQVKLLKPGMSQETVINILGNPVLTYTFRDDRLDYVYTFQQGSGPREMKRLTVHFKNNRLTATEFKSQTFSKK